MAIADWNELAEHAMEDIDTTFAPNVKAGEIMVAGKNFGCGSSREHAPGVIKAKGVPVIIAHSFARIFFRNAINIGLPVVEIGEQVDRIDAGDAIGVDLSKGIVYNLTKNEQYQGTELPQFIQDTEIIAAAKAVCDVAFEKAGVKVNWIDKKAGGASIDAYGVPLTEDTIEACKNADAVLLGAVGGPKWDNVDPSIRPEKAILGLRKELGLFCNLRPVKIYSSLQEYSPLKKELVQDVDFVIVRELTGGIYFGEREEAQGEGANEFAWDKETYSRYEVERIMDIAMETARKRNKKVVSVDKANVLASSRLWRKIAQEKAAANPDIATDYFYVDNTAMQLVVNPAQFDVIVTTNLFGDILSDEGAVISGSIGLLPSASMGTGTALYEPIHGSAPDIMGQNLANPLGTILSAAMMCRHSLDLPQVADAIEKAVEQVLVDGYRTGDIYREGLKRVGTTEMAQAVIERL